MEVCDLQEVFEEVEAEEEGGMMFGYFRQVDLDNELARFAFLDSIYPIHEETSADVKRNKRPYSYVLKCNGLLGGCGCPRLDAAAVSA